MKQMAEVRGMERVAVFLQILVILAGSEDCEPIASPGFAANTSFTTRSVWTGSFSS